MNHFREMPILVVIGILLMLLGCSQSGNPVLSSDTQDPSENMPLIVINNQTGVNNSLGIMGAYNLSINLSDKTAELTPMRVGSIGESYIVSGIGFFTIAPCSNCLSISGFKLSGGNVALTFKIKHPFDPGDPTQLPTAKNRLDLDVFDLAMVVVPTTATPINFPLTAVDVYADVIANAHGYTRELANLIGNNSAMPYVLVEDNTKSPPPHNWNKFAMGAESFFDVILKLNTGIPLKFDTYLTMGYGASAKKAQRLEPKYYNPEFNRKAAWKVSVIPPGPLFDNQPIPSTVKVKVYDWQIGATVFGNPSDFHVAPSDNIYAASEVESVSIEVLGMAPSPFTSSTPIGGTGLPNDPLIYEIQIVNVNMLAAGTYTGIVKVTDERSPLTPADERDYLIDSPDGVILDNYVIPEYATYQTFKAEVIHDGLTINQVNWEIHNSPDPQIIKDSDHGSATVGFLGSPDVHYFNLSVNGEWVVQNVPLMSHAGMGVAQTVSFNFDLGNPPGMDVIEVLAGWSIDPTPIPGMPPPGGWIPVGERDVRMMRGFLGHIDIGPPPLLKGSNVLSFYVANRHMTGLDCEFGECVPSAISNSLSWMQDAYGIPSSDKPTDMEAAKRATGWTTDPEARPVMGGDFPANKDQHMQDNGYGINTQTHPPGDPPNNISEDSNVSSTDLDNAMNAVNQGKDVEIVGGGHCAAVVGMSKNADGTYTITVAHDTDQGNDGGVAIETMTYDPSLPFPFANGGSGFDDEPINAFVVESPWP